MPLIEKLSTKISGLWPRSRPQPQDDDSPIESRPEAPRPSLYPPDYIEDERTATAKARSIAKCSDLLRQKYELDIDIAGCGRGQESEKRQLKAKSDAIYREVCKSVEHWRLTSRTRWTQEEWNCLEEIFVILDWRPR